jgi:hypothetical protein
MFSLKKVNDAIEKFQQAEQGVTFRFLLQLMPEERSSHAPGVVASWNLILPCDSRLNRKAVRI